MPMKNPPHPGDFIRTEIVEAAGLSVTEAAGALRVSRPALSSLLNGKAQLSGEMALRIEKAFGVKMDTLMRMQAAWNIAETRKRENEIEIGTRSESTIDAMLEKLQHQREQIEQAIENLKARATLNRPSAPVPHYAFRKRVNGKPHRKKAELASRKNQPAG